MLQKCSDTLQLPSPNKGLVFFWMEVCGIHGFSTPENISVSKLKSLLAREWRFICSALHQSKPLLSSLHEYTVQGVVIWIEPRWRIFYLLILFSWESVLLCSHTWPTSYFLHKIHLYLRTEQAQSHIIQTLLWLRWLSSQRREAVRTPAIYSVIKEYKPYDEVQLVRKIICVLGPIYGQDGKRDVLMSAGRLIVIASPVLVQLIVTVH